MWKAPVNWIENTGHFPQVHLFGGGGGAKDEVGSRPHQVAAHRSCPDLRHGSWEP